MGERGFIYPVTLVIFTLFSLFLFIEWNQYVTEKKFADDMKYHEKKEFYFLQSLKKLETILMEETFPIEGIFQYKDGIVSYKVDEIGEALLQVTLYVEIESREKTMGLGYFDRDFKKIIKWIEKG